MVKDINEDVDILLLEMDEEDWESVLAESLAKFYKWLGSRKVLVRNGFFMMLSASEDFLRSCDFLSRPTLHSDTR
eukprot:scaffold8804_cov161-Ochromonas_danica.AAC.5